MKKLGVLVVLGAAILVAGYYFFVNIGGSPSIQISLVEKAPDVLAGKTYIGTPQDPKLGETFKEIETLQSLNPGSKIHTIYYVEPAGKLDTMKVFVGIDMPFPPATMEALSFTEEKYILSKIEGSRWVMPNPEKVKDDIREFAKAKQLELTGVFIDKIISESEVQVIAPVK
ncbi:hypothetical protein [Algoriphagus mannitolivorans]|uniref:hypothetical protein n=1 Tax=Algoriphagus mannitolivorans TaxID=226504 RepID=UPI000422A6B3|nr:hypothetical protein [Algoriphagus mannitolivorans]